MSFPRYTRYKDSGVEWLGEVPEHWEICALKRIVSMQSGESITAESIEESGDYPVFGGNGLRGYTSAFTHEGNFVLIGRQGALCGNINYAHGRFWASEHAVVATPTRQVNTLWLGEMLRAMNLNQYSLTAAQPGLSVDLVGRILTTVPSTSEQTLIAAFLDRETAKIDELVAEQRRLMELLKEKRQAVISHAVTKGLNPNAPMKPSGVEWLGDVPEHWDVVRLGYRGRLQNGLSIDGEAFGAGDPFISYSDVYNNATVPDVPSGLVRSSPLDQSKCGLEAGDVLFTRTSETVDDIGVASTCTRSIPRSTFAGFLIRFRPYEGILDPGYSTYLFRNQGVQGHFAGTMNLVTRASLSQAELRSLPICIPPLEEQRVIAATLDAKTEMLRDLIATTQQAINLLLERRTALISAAVTGQIDVREVSA